MVLLIFFSYPIYLLFLVIIKCDASVFYRLPAGFSVHLPRNENRCVLELRLTENNTQLITKNNENIKVTSVVVVRSLFCVARQWVRVIVGVACVAAAATLVVVHRRFAPKADGTKCIPYCILYVYMFK